MLHQCPLPAWKYEISLQIYSQNEKKYVAATPLRDNNL